jgi:hydroxymethylpyrimidine/phosphomethylpyrimidine kinase
MPTPPLVLVFAANDPSGGAGLTADLLTVASLGCHPLPVITGTTVQDSARVEAIDIMDSEWVAEQARCILEDMPVQAIKVGVIGSVENVAVIAEIAADYPDIPLILDPVLASGAGDDLTQEDIIGAIRELLLPVTTIITPNSHEARRLATDDPDEQEEISLEVCARRLCDLGAEYVLVTGTHENTPEVINALYTDKGKLRTANWPRLPGSYHGSGCTLASAIASGLAGGLNVVEAVEEAQEYTYQTLQGAFRPGMGQFIPDRLFWARVEDDDDTDTPATDDDA